MSYTQGTTHYNLPQTLGDDKRDWFDTNQAFADVDSALYSAETGVQTIDKDLTTVKSDLLTAKSDITALKSHNAQTDVKLSALETLTAQHTVEIEDVRNDAEDMVCAINEPTATAQYEHLTGAYFRYNNTLYIATEDISKGDTIVPNVNCRTTDVTTVLQPQDLGSISIESSDWCTVKDAGRIYRCGNFVSISFILQITTNLDADTTYTVKINNMPLPVHNITGATFILTQASRYNFWGKSLALYPAVSGIHSGNTLELSFVYFTLE